MKIVLTTVGTTGDIQPYLALVRGLLARGHDVRAASHPMHRARFEATGAEFRGAGPPLSTEALARVLEDLGKLRDPYQQFAIFAERVFLNDVERQFEEHCALSKDADVVVAHRFDWIGQEAAIKNGVPWASVTILPEIIRTHEAPRFRIGNLGRWWTKFIWDSAETKVKPLNQKVQAVLQKLGCPARPLSIVGAMSPRLNLVAASPSFVTVHEDWPATVKVTGVWFHDEPSYEPPGPLSSFLRAHDRPVVITFGSMSAFRTDRTRALVLKAIERVGCSAVVQIGGAGDQEESGAAGVFFAGYVPHEFLFARASAVVHHAGAGTTMAAVRAGVASITVPHFFDQYYWAGMAHSRGVATKPLLRSRLKARPLAQRIREALAKVSMQEKARVLSEKVRAERGVDRAIELIESIG